MMEFTKENVLSLLTDAQDLMKNTQKEYALRSEEAPLDGLKDWYQGKSQAYESCSSYLGDIIKWIRDYMITTEELIDKEHK